jgi:hypothetical protein
VSVAIAAPLMRREFQVEAAPLNDHHGHDVDAHMLSLDWPLTQFGFFGHCALTTGSFCVFGPVLSSPARGPSSLAMAQRRIEVVFCVMG